MATMAASPPKDAPAFEQNWDKSDAAFLDPTSLPIQRLPRAWDRKQEVRHVGNGRKKEIWRRYGTRSRTSGATSTKDPEDDVRARSVKRLQRMSPKAIEKSAISRFGKTRAFKATRWDRRKSVLPRKKTVGVDTSVEDEGEEEQDTTITDPGDGSFSETITGNDRVETQDMVLLPEGEDRRATFTFLFNEDENVSYQEDIDDTSISTAAVAHAEYTEEDFNNTGFSQTPRDVSSFKGTPAEPLSYPELPPMSTSEDNAAVAIDKGPMVKEGVHKHVEEESGSVQLEGDEMDGTPAIETLLSAPFATLEDNEATIEGVAYPVLPQHSNVEESAERIYSSLENDHAAPLSPRRAQDDIADFEFNDDDDPDENFTEASLQLNILREMQMEEPTSSDTRTTPAAENHLGEDVEGIAGQEEPPTEPPSAIDDVMDDITSGLTLGPVMSSREPTPRKLRSPSPPPRTASGPEDATMTFAFDDDTALLKDFLSRAAASKANKADNIARRESLQNRRDSDVVRHALASPRKALEDKDPNSPSKYDNETTLNLSQTLTLDMESPVLLSPSTAQAQAQTDDVDDSKAGSASRRSSRARKSRLPAPASIPTGPPKISVKRDGSDPVVLRKTDAQELSLLTRSNTRKNKQGAVAVNVRLLKLSNEARTAEGNDTLDPTESTGQVTGKKYVRWDTQLAYFQENTEAIADALADAESLATPDELSLATPAAKPTRVKVKKVDMDATPKVRKVKNLGSKNGTPGKGLLAPASLLPDTMLADKEELEQKQRILKPKTSRIKKMPVANMDTAAAAPVDSRLPVLEIAPVGIDPAKASSTKERKSRLATPRKVKLPQLSSTVVGNGKENQGKGIAAATPKKGIPMPSVVAPSAVDVTAGATGLPRRRGRKL